MARIRKLIGKKCFLSPICLQDAAIYAHWLNDLEIVQNLTVANSVINIETEAAFLSTLSKEHNYGIVDLATDQLIGTCGFSFLNHYDRTAELGIFIGNKDYLHKGYGTEAVRLLLDYGYRYLNLHNVMLRVMDFNTHALEAYKKIGFKMIGTRRQCEPRNQKMIDIIYMDILPEDFYNE
ncbi:MAG: GNAT family protein [Petrimonas sp.]|nr:GNAT family protein [Petrimonas sp.]